MKTQKVSNPHRGLTTGDKLYFTEGDPELAQAQE